MQNFQRSQFDSLSLQFLDYLYSQTSRKINILIQDLTILYKAFKIQQNFDDFQRTLNAMLIPIDLQAKMSSMAGNFSSNFAYQKTKYSTSKQFPPENDRSYIPSSNSNPLPTLRFGYQAPSEEKKIQKVDGLLNRRLDNFNSTKVKSQHPEERRRRACRYYNGGRPILTLEQEQIVKEYMLEAKADGEILTIQKIAKKAKSIAQNIHFQGSAGWAKNFLKRYPDMKQVYYSAREKKAQEGLLTFDPEKLEEGADDFNINSETNQENGQSKTNKKYEQWNSDVNDFSEYGDTESIKYQVFEQNNDEEEDSEDISLKKKQSTAGRPSNGYNGSLNQVRKR